MHLSYKLCISDVLKQPFQESITKTVSSVWLRFLTIFTQNFVSIVKHNAAALAKKFKPFDAGDNAFGRNVLMLFIRYKQNVCINYCMRPYFHA